MALEIFDCEQGTPEWFACRAGIPTASEFGTVMAEGRKKGEPSKTRADYMFKLAGELITGEVQDSYTNPHMERGKIMEAEARDLYCMLTGHDLKKVGFIRNGRAGCSPDSVFVNAKRGLEIKTKLPHLQLKALLAGVLPAEHKPQVQGIIWKAELESCDFVSYWPKMKPLIVTVQRDDAYIRELDSAVNQFNDELDALVEKYNRL